MAKPIHIVFSLVLLYGCSKNRASNLAGLYECNFRSFGWHFGDYYDTTYVRDLRVVAHNGIISIDGYYGFEVPEKSLNYENCYQSGSSQKWEKLCFPKNGVEFSYGHSYHNSSGTTTYIGTRKKINALI